MAEKNLTYKDAGVDIDAGNRLVERIRPMVARTSRPEVLAGLGGFGGLFALPPDRYREPVLVSGTDGVGTKLKLAQMLDKHDSIGIDLVAMCVNDVLVQGAEPLFFLDYFASGRLDVDVAAQVVSGIAEGCVQAGAALIGGETAEMPDMYGDGEYDLAGFCVAAVEREELIDGRHTGPGDALIGIASSGPHSNGYSLIRRVLERSGDEHLGTSPVSERLLAPTRIYVKPVLELVRQVPVKALSHITGGGITENLPRVLPDGIEPVIETASWQRGDLFDWLAERGNIETAEMRRTFNCGVGMIVVVDADDASRTIDILEAAGETAWQIGYTTEGSSEVRYS